MTDGGATPRVLAAPLVGPFAAIFPGTVVLAVMRVGVRVAVAVVAAVAVAVAFGVVVVVVGMASHTGLSKTDRAVDVPAVVMAGACVGGGSVALPVDVGVGATVVRRVPATHRRGLVSS